jgi:hypothetical protein
MVSKTPQGISGYDGSAELRKPAVHIPIAVRFQMIPVNCLAKVDRPFCSLMPVAVFP